MPRLLTEKPLLLFLAGFLVLHGLTQEAQGLELAAGASAVEEGDDRMRPAVSLKASSDFYLARAYYYGSGYGPVSLNTYMLTVGRRFPLFRTKTLSSALGGAILREDTVIQYESPDDADFNQNDQRYNLGAFCGLYWRALELDALFVETSWESALFPAGVSGGILLATGRKQYLSLTVGVEL